MEEIKSNFEKILENESFKWFISFRNCAEIWELHPSYLMLEIGLYLLSFFTFVHAIRHGGRFIYLWFATIFHGLMVECLSYFIPEIDNFWHAQSMVMFVGKRLPLHIILLYPCLLYIAICVVTRMHLKSWGRPFMVGLATVLLDIPFDLVGIRHLFWTWHDTDPNIYDRNYFVPWTSYYFHASFAASFTFVFFTTRKLLGHATGYEADGFFKETVCTILTGLLSMPLGILQFIPLYHSLHDVYHIHSEVCVLLFLAIYFLLAWMADRHPVVHGSHDKYPGSAELLLIVLIHYGFYIYLAFFGQPENIKSVGFHQPIGNCTHISDVQTASGIVLQKNTYLCVSEFDEAYYDFHCVQSKPADDALWYTICGVPILDKLEYMIIVSAFCAFGFIFYLEAILGRIAVCTPMPSSYPRMGGFKQSGEGAKKQQASAATGKGKPKKKKVPTATLR